MRTRALGGLLTAGALFVFGTLGHAHGGQYVGPGDVVPPGGGGGHGGSTPGDPPVPTTGGPSGPRAPVPGGATGGGTGGTTGGSGQPAGRQPGGSSGRGVQLDPDLTEWTFWWEFNKDSFLRLKDAVHLDSPETGSLEFYAGPTRRRLSRDALKPTTDQIQTEILPALKKAIDSTENRDIVSSCMVAMAKIGSDHPDFRLLDVFAPRLASRDQEIRETAALALGIAAIAGEQEMTLLADLALDTEHGAGRAATGGGVDYRTRSFATYGLGLLAHEHSGTEIKARAFGVMRQLLHDDAVADRNLKVAAISAIGILDIGTSSAADRHLLEQALQCLDDYYGRRLGVGEQLIQSHCPTAIAKLIGRDHERSGHYRQLFAADLQDKGQVRRASNDIARSCAMALGMMVRPNDDTDETRSPDAAFSRLLLDTYHGHSDAQTRSFALLALGQIGGAVNREILLREFDKGRKNQEKPWCALALGVYEFSRRAQPGNDAPDALIGNTLTDALRENKDPSLLGALAIGLGLSRASAAADLMRSLMVGNVAKQEMAGYLCIGLALMNDTRSIDTIRAVVARSARHETLLQQAAIALGKLGDKRVADDLQSMLAEQSENLAKLAAISAALGLIGDRRSVAPLQEMLFDSDLGNLSRAFAAVALGGIADKGALPWNAKLRSNTNYRAAVETLTNQGTGILDIL